MTGGQQNTTSYVLDTNRTANCVDQACALWSTREIYLRSAVVKVSCPGILDSLLPDFSAQYHVSIQEGGLYNTIVIGFPSTLLKKRANMLQESYVFGKFLT